MVMSQLPLFIIYQTIKNGVGQSKEEWENGLDKQIGRIVRIH